MGQIQKILFIFIVLTCFFTMSGCSKPSLRDHFEDLQTEKQKETYIRYYPILDKNQRLQMLSAHWEKAPEEIIIPPGIDIENSHIKNLEIRSEPSGMIKEGTQLKIFGTLEYSNGLKVDATEDITWGVAPDFVKIKENAVTFGCLSSNIYIHGDFLEYKKNSLEIKIRKPLQSLTLEVAEQSLSVEDDVHVKLRLIATCKDATTTDVSCLAQWSSSEKLGDINGCGMFHSRFKKLKPGQKIHFRAEYGNRFIEKDIRMPERGRF